jgi:hypothetical protein
VNEENIEGWCDFYRAYSLDAMQTELEGIGRALQKGVTAGALRRMGKEQRVAILRLLTDWF